MKKHFAGNTFYYFPTNLSLLKSFVIEILNRIIADANVFVKNEVESTILIVKVFFTLFTK